MKKLTRFSKELRKNSTDAELLLWRYLRAKRLAGLKFKRQSEIGPYIADFVCFEKRIIVECDGGQHAEQVKKDQHRDKWFKSQGFTILRFWNNEILQKTNAVLEEVLRACGQDHPLPNPLPLRERG